MGATKITTCCYCGSRAALVLRGKERHELSCGTCGAPIHAMKMLPKAAQPAPSVETSVRRAKPKKTRNDDKQRSVPRPKKRRKTKHIGRKLWSEFWDVIEDVVDEVFD